MCVSMFLSQTIGCYLALIGLAMLIYQPRFRKYLHDLTDSPLMICLTGSIHLLLGLLIVISHNIWVYEWPVLITIIGWISLLTGIWRIYFEEHFVHTVKSVMTHNAFIIISAARFLVGAYLMWIGFNL